MVFIPDTPVTRKKSSFIPDEGSYRNDLTNEQYLTGTAKNILPSAGRTAMAMGSGIVNMANPNIDDNTLAQTARLAYGGLQKLDPTKDKVISKAIAEQTPIRYVTMADRARGMSTDYQPQAEAVGKFYKDRYGGIENIKKSMYEDPTGVALDVSTVLLGGSGLASATGKAGLASKLSKAAQFTDPLQSAGKITKFIPKPKISAGEWLAKQADTIPTRGMGSPTMLNKAKGMSPIPMSELFEKYNLWDRTPETILEGARKAGSTLDDLTVQYENTSKAMKKPITKTIPDVNQSILNEARKYKSAEEFMNNYQKEKNAFINQKASEATKFQKGYQARTSAARKKSLDMARMEWEKLETPERYGKKLDIYNERKVLTDIYNQATSGLSTQGKIDVTSIIKNLDKKIRSLERDARFSDAVRLEMEELIKRRDILNKSFRSTKYAKPTSITKIKQLFQKDVPDSQFGLPTSETARARGTKTAYKEILTGLEKKVPGTKSLGREEAAMRQLYEAAQKHEGRVMGAQPIKLKGLLGGGVGASIAGIPGAIGGYVLNEAINSPLFLKYLTKTMKGASRVKPLKTNVFKDIIKSGKVIRMTNHK